MELSEFAHRILFSPDLESKLSPPGEITDQNPGPARPAPLAPARPPELRFKDSHTSPARFPKIHQLDQTAERGRLLHFFANHELLAVELMALVLLRFPDAPPAFRRGVLQTLKDEQEHTRLYLERMHACGIAFGELPVSGFFWRAVSGMQNPADYVAGLSLTFEQANLDFARHFAQGFQTVGDSESAQLLDRIYRDEIAHVAYGLKWFRRWKASGESDWNAFCRHLKFPLSPQRAKGFHLNIEGRRAAGFDSDFIARLEVFSQSKGRTPTVYLFNPFAEGYLAAGFAFTPNRLQSDLALDLAHLPLFLGHADDIVLVPQIPRIEFLASLKHAGFPVPEFVTIPPVAQPATTAWDGRKLGRLRPWAWSPDSVRILTPFAPAVTGDPIPFTSRLSPESSGLFSKAWSADFLREFLSNQKADWLCTSDDAGVAVAHLSDALQAIASIRSRGHHRVVAKEALGLAGSNALRLWEPEWTDAQRRWMESAFDKERTLVLEPWHERVFDFSIQLERHANRLEIVGYAGLLTDARGQYLGNQAGPDHRFRIPSPLAELLRHPSRPADLPRRLHETIQSLVHHLESRLAQTGYVGPIGIDAFVYRLPDGICRLKPVVEINPRHTMGRLTLELMRFVQSGSHGRFRLVNRPQLRNTGFPDFPSFAQHLTQRHPIRLEGDPQPRIREGAICLSDPTTARTVLAIFQVARTHQELPQLGEP